MKESMSACFHGKSISLAFQPSVAFLFCLSGLCCVTGWQTLCYFHLGCTTKHSGT